MTIVNKIDSSVLERLIINSLRKANAGKSSSDIDWQVQSVKKFMNSFGIKFIDAIECEDGCVYQYSRFGNITKQAIRTCEIV